MKTQYGDFFSKDKLKNRFKTLKKTYADLKAMLDLSGFGWDDARKMVTAEPQVWKEYVAAHPKAAHYKNKTFPDWASLAIIFGDSVADGRDGFASNDPEPIETVVEEEKQPNDMNNAYEDHAFEDIDPSIGTNRRQRQMSTAMTSRHVILFCYEMDEDMEFFFFCAQTVGLICVLGYYYSYGQRDRVHNSIISGESFVDELLNGHERNCFDLLRVGKGCYVNLSNELRQRVRRLYGTYGGVLSGGAVRERIIRAFLVEEQKIVKKDGSRGEKSKSRVRSRAVSRGNKSRSRAVSRGKRSESRVSRSQNRGRGRSVKSLKDSVAVKSKEEWSGTEDAEADSNESALN
ncbi:hypothetical protein AAC387_Pa08g1807 [Persea americana]